MNDPAPRKSRQSAALLVGIALTVVALLSHRFLPDRRLSLDPAKPGAVSFLMNFGDEGTRVDWVDQSRQHFRCRFSSGSPDASCGYTYLLYAGDDAAHGVDLSRFRTLDLTVRYSGPARYVRVSIRNFDPRYSRVADTNSPKFNLLNIQPKDLENPLAIDLQEFSVPEWWVSQYDVPRQLSHPQLDNATAFTLYLQNEPADVDHDIRIEKIEFTGDWISAESWYLGLLVSWLAAGMIYGVAQLVMLRRAHREQRRIIRALEGNNEQLQGEKEKFEKLSTLDGLTKVLNRHGIDRFIESLRVAGIPASVIVIDLDHFKKINDHRGHYIGDRVLQTVGEILRTHTRATDGLGRWGGEEFVLLCPGASLSKASELAEKLRQRIMKTNFIPEDPIAITASFGVATSQPGESFEDAFRQADEALYLAKGRGRNCVVAAGSEQMHKVTGARKGTWALISGRFKLHASSSGSRKL